VDEFRFGELWFDYVFSFDCALTRVVKTILNGSSGMIKRSLYLLVTLMLAEQSATAGMNLFGSIPCASEDCCSDGCASDAGCDATDVCGDDGCGDDGCGESC
jgi:hypothetical protein